MPIEVAMCQRGGPLLAVDRFDVEVVCRMLDGSIPWLWGSRSLTVRALMLAGF